MAVAVKKYNPGFLTDDEIVDSFCVRTAEFESIVESLRESAASSSTHSLVIGPRGSGKTHLLLRVAAEVRRDLALSGIFPVVFSEESYEVATCGEFWLECLGRLAEQAPEDQRASLRLTYDDLRTVSDDRTLADRCLGSLLDFADRHDTRLLLIVENLNMLFSDMSDPDVGWQLRKTLQTEPRIILLGSATSRFDEIDSPEHALYDLFRVLTLRPLDTAECEALWETVSGKPSVGDTVRPLEILTGGSPRLISIIARFGADRSFADLMGSLLDLVDEHTEYFKSHLEALPAQERRVYLALARLWRPATAREVADQARIDTNACSAQLRRLVDRGVVAIEGGTPRRREYYLTERLYNIYYLLRRGVGTDGLVKALIEFMICFYSTSELGGVLAAIQREARLQPTLPTRLVEQMAEALVTRAQALDQMGQSDEAIEVYDQMIERLDADKTPGVEPQVALALMNKSLLLNRIGREDEGITTCDRLVSRFGARKDGFFPILVASALDGKGRALTEQDDVSGALSAYDQALIALRGIVMPELDFLVAGITQRKGVACLIENRVDEALTIFDEVIVRFGTGLAPQLAGTVTNALVAKALVVRSLGTTINESEVSLLLACLAELDELPPAGIVAIVDFIVAEGACCTLELIQKSLAAEMLLPLVTALQQELGQNPQAAKETHEVAQDIRRLLAEVRGEVESNATNTSP